MRSTFESDNGRENLLDIKGILELSVLVAFGLECSAVNPPQVVML